MFKQMTLIEVYYSSTFAPKIDSVLNMCKKSYIRYSEHKISAITRKHVTVLCIIIYYIYTIALVHITV